ncbi:MAG: DNA polymerase IV [Bacteroidales bacterium]|nr:DNA polymerase IV [Bacteroidales bacterium]
MKNNYRKIIHIDMDAFFASVEQRDKPELKGKPVAVGGKGARGVVAAASYEARKYGVRSAMPSKIAIRKCPHLIFADSNFKKYKEVSNQIREIFFEYTDLVEPLSLDEAFLDVTENKINLPSATLIAKQIKKKIKERTQLTASAGVSFNKFLAKIASDYYKPDGFYAVTPDIAQYFIEKLPIEKFFGVGKVSAEKMHKLGIITGFDLKQKSLQVLINNFGKQGNYYYNIARGIDNREVNPDRIRKSIGAEKTFAYDIQNIENIYNRTEQIAETLIERCKKAETYGKTLTLKIKYSDFKQITRSKSVSNKIKNINDIMQISDELFEQIDFSYNSIRLIGLSITNLDNQPENVAFQLSIEFDI